MNKILGSLALAIASAPLAFANDDSVSAIPAEPVSMVIVALFGIVFLVVCVWIAIAILQEDRRSKAEALAKEAHAAKHVGQKPLGA